MRERERRSNDELSRVLERESERERGIEKGERRKEERMLTSARDRERLTI